MVARRLFLNSVLIGVFKEAHVISEEKRFAFTGFLEEDLLGKVSPET